MSIDHWLSYFVRWIRIGTANELIALLLLMFCNYIWWASDSDVTILFVLMSLISFMVWAQQQQQQPQPNRLIWRQRAMENQNIEEKKQVNYCNKWKKER